MSWRAISDGRRVLRRPSPDQSQVLLSKGTFLVEFVFSAESTAGQKIVDLERHLPWDQRFCLWIDSGGTVRLEARQGHVESYAEVTLPDLDLGTDLRITVSWNAPERVGLMTVECPGNPHSAFSVFHDPIPWSLGDAALLVAGGSALDPTIALLAVSDAIEPTGLSGGFAAGTLIDTVDGPKPVETLKPFDQIQTSEHGVQPIRQVASYEVPSAGWFAPIQLTAPFFGLSRDMAVAPDHRLLVTGVDAEYLFGAEEVLVEAHYLKRIAEPLKRSRPATVRYTHVLLDAHVCLSVGGGWGESLYVGGLADDAARHATSILSHLPMRTLPRHGCIAGPQLKGYEAIVLVSSMCA